MATSFVIRKVTEALLAILRHDLAGITTLPESSIKAGRPESASDQLTARTLLLYLYRVVESPFLKNVGPSVEPGPTPDGITVRRDPLAIDLYYLLIPGSTDAAFLETYDILGAAMLSFHDHGIFTLGEWIIPGALPELTDTEKNLQIRIDFDRLDTADLIRIWEAVQHPYRLSVSYVVRTLQIESQLAAGGRRVGERHLDFEQQP